MGLRDVWNKRREKKAGEAPRETDAGQNGGEAVTLGDLLGALDLAGQELGRSSLLTRDEIAAYAETLRDMKRAIAGVLDAKTSPALRQVLKVVFSASLLQTFQFGSPEENDEAKNTVFDGIKALSAPEKEQVVLTLRLQVLTLRSEQQKNKYWIAAYTADQGKARQALDAVRLRTDLPADEITSELTKLLEALNQLEYSITALKKENDSVEITILQKEQQLREVTSDLSAAGLRELRKMIDEFNLTLPTAETLYQTVGEIEKRTNQDLADLHSKSSMLLRALGKNELTLDSVTQTAAETDTAQNREPRTRETDTAQLL